MDKLKVMSGRLARQYNFTVKIIGKRVRPADESRHSGAKTRTSPGSDSRMTSAPGLTHSQARIICKCPSGHTFYAIDRVNKSQCPFCEEFLVEFKRIAAARDAELVSTHQSKYIRFLCNIHKETFTLTASETRRGDRWCNLCKDNIFSQSSPIPRELPRRIVDPSSEQDHLLDSAKALFKASVTEKPIQVSIIIINAKKDLNY